MILQTGIHFVIRFPLDSDENATLYKPFLTRGYAKRGNGFLLGLRYANVSLAHSGVESS